MTGRIDSQIMENRQRARTRRRIPAASNASIQLYRASLCHQSFLWRWAYDVSVLDNAQAVNHGLTISASTVHAHQSQRDDREVGRPNARKIRPLPAWANFEAVGVRGERDSK